MHLAPFRCALLLRLVGRPRGNRGRRGPLRLAPPRGTPLLINHAPLLAVLLRRAGLVGTLKFIVSLNIIDLRSASISTISGTNQSFGWTDWNQNGSNPTQM